MAKKSHTDAEAEVLSQAMQADGHTAADQRVYEVGFHVVPTVPEDGVAAVVATVHTALGTAEIISEQFPHKMALAYTVERSDSGRREKYNEAYFGCIKFALERSAIPTFEQALRTNKAILRFLLIETTREDIATAPRRAVFASDRLEGETIKKPVVEEVKSAEVSDEDLDKSIDALVS